MTDHMKALKDKTYRRPRIAFNWDGDDAVRWAEWPLTREKFVKIVLEQYEGTHIDTMLWSPGDGMSLFNHPTRYGLVWGQHAEQFCAPVWIGADNGRRLREHGDEMTILSEESSRLGFLFYLSIRMNDTHDHVYPSFWSSVKERHPEWLVGTHDPNATDTESLETHTAVNYALDEVREYRMNIIREMVERYRIDGLQLDFATFPPFFRPGEEQQHIPVMNDFMRGIRALLDRIAAERGTYIALNVVVMDELENNPLLGLDVETWARESIVDEIVGGRSYVRFYPLDNLIALGKQTGVGVYGASNHEQPLACDRAWAMTHWESGVDGLVLYNYYYNHEAVRRTGRFLLYDYNTEPLNPFYCEIASRQKLQYLDKTYKAVPGPEDLPVWLSPVYAGVQVPRVIRLNEPVTIQVVCFDDLPAIVSSGRRAGAQMRLHMNFPTPEDTFQVAVNGHPVPSYSFIRYGNNFRGIEWDQDPAHIIRGRNLIDVELTSRPPHVFGGSFSVGRDEADLKITDAEIELTYG